MCNARKSPEDWTAPVDASLCSHCLGVGFGAHADSSRTRRCSRRVRKGMNRWKTKPYNAQSFLFFRLNSYGSRIIENGWSSDGEVGGRVCGDVEKDGRGKV